MMAGVKAKALGTLSLFALLLCRVASAQEFELDTNALRQALEVANEWAQENLDDTALQALRQVDRDKVEEFLRDYQSALQGEYVLDLAALKDAAMAVLPLLESYDETESYAVWLKSRLDYLEVAEELKRAAPPEKLPRSPTQNPTTSSERKIWQAKLQSRPPPKGAEALVAKLKPIFASERVPTELVWIAEVESSFDSRARSPAGAAGLFQLMPATAKRYGLHRWPRDQRYQPEASARATARYLKDLHKQFGDWPLAIAAYNAGEGMVKRTLDRRKAKTYDAIATRLPAETQLFVPKVEATLLKREEVQLVKLKSPVDTLKR